MWYPGMEQACPYTTNSEHVHVGFDRPTRPIRPSTRPDSPQTMPNPTLPDPFFAPALCYSGHTMGCARHGGKGCGNGTQPGRAPIGKVRVIARYPAGGEEVPRSQLDGCAARCGTRTGEAASGVARNLVGETARATEGCVRRSLDLEKKHLMDVLSACETLATSSGPYFTHSSHDGRLYALKYLDHGVNITL